MKGLYVALALAAAAIIGLVIYAKTRDPEQAAQATKEEARADRRRYALTVQDSLRNQMLGPSTTVKAAGADEDILEISVTGCSADMLRTLLAAPKISGIMNELGFYKVTCRGSGISVSPDYIPKSRR